MAEIVQSLFGVTPESYQQAQQQRADAQALQYAQLTPFQQANYAIGRGANMLGGAIGGALGGQDPELQRVTMRQQIARQIDYNDPASMRQGFIALRDAGDSQGALQLQQIILSQDKTRAETSKALRERQGADPFEQLVRTGKYTPASLSAYRQSGDVGQLELMEKTKDDVVVVGNALVSKSTGQPIYQGPDAQKYSGFAQELRDAGLEPGTEPFQKRMLEYVTKKTEGAGKGTGNVTIGGISLNTGEAGKAAAKVIGTNVANVEQQYALDTAFKDALGLLDQGIYGGAYGPEKQFVAKFVGIGDPKKVENTEVFMANIGEIVIPRLQQFGGNDSNEELKYLQKVVAGDQRLEPAAMKRILASAEKKVQKNLARLQAQAAAGQTGAALPIGPVTPAAAPAPTKRYNPQTRKIEAISGD
jgi:nucleotide-binding universal stress UspA family protein